MKVKKINEESRDKTTQKTGIKWGGKEESDTSGKQVGPFIPFPLLFWAKCSALHDFHVPSSMADKELYK